MRLLYIAAGFLWAVLIALLLGLAAVLLETAMPGKQQFLAAVILIGLATAAGLQLQNTHRQIREMTASRIVLGSEGVEFQLSGRARDWKGLPEVPNTLLRWNDILSIVREKKRFVYPSVVPLGYPLDVYTVYSREGAISFTRECLPNAGRIAGDIAAHIGAEL